MADYLFIESRDPYDSTDAQRFHELVKGVRQRNHTTTLFLVQNGVLSARLGAKLSDRYGELARAGVTVLADEFSLRERAIDRVADGVQTTDMDKFVSLVLVPGTKAIWH